MQFIETCYSDRLELEVGGLEVLLGVASMHGKVLLGVASMHGKVLLGVASMHRKVLVGKGPIRGGFHSRKGPIRGGFHAWKGPIRGGLYISPVSEAGGDEDQALLSLLSYIVLLMLTSPAPSLTASISNTEQQNRDSTSIYNICI